jgi:hypothetical protein
MIKKKHYKNLRGMNNEIMADLGFLRNNSDQRYFFYPINMTSCMINKLC